MKKAKNWKQERRKQNKDEPQRIMGFSGFVSEETKVETLEAPKLNNVKMEDLQVTSEKTGTLEVEAEHIKVILPIEVYYKMMAYVKLVDDEINGLGLVEKIDRATFRVTEIFLLDQKVSKAACEIDKDAFFKLMMQLEKEGKNPSMIRFWWHSHNTMGADFWSSRDAETSKMFAGSEYLISLVAAHDGEMRAKISIYEPVDLFVDNIKIIIEQPCVATDLLEKCKAEITEKVRTERTYYQTPNLIVIPGKEEKIAKGSEDKINEDLFEGNYGPWGDTFIENDVRVQWNKQTKSYEGYDVYTNIKLTEQEFVERTNMDYNDKGNNPYAYDDNYYNNLRLE